MKLTSSSYNSYLFNYSFLGFFAYVYNIYIYTYVCVTYTLYMIGGVFLCVLISGNAVCLSLICFSLQFLISAISS